jgi:hypothetical protein
MVRGAMLMSMVKKSDEEAKKKQSLGRHWDFTLIGRPEFEKSASN